MNYEDVIIGNSIEKKFKNFELNVPELHIPKGFSTALIGENTIWGGKIELRNGKSFKISRGRENELKELYVDKIIRPKL